jgi:hypothetical protein
VYLLVCMCVGTGHSLKRSLLTVERLLHFKCALISIKHSVLVLIGYLQCCALSSKQDPETDLEEMPHQALSCSSGLWQ